MVHTKYWFPYSDMIGYTLPRGVVWRAKRAVRRREADSGRGWSILLRVLVFLNEECLDSTASAICSPNPKALTLSPDVMLIKSWIEDNNIIYSLLFHWCIHAGWTEHITCTPGTALRMLTCIIFLPNLAGRLVPVTSVIFTHAFSVKSAHN